MFKLESLSISKTEKFQHSVKSSLLYINLLFLSFFLKIFQPMENNFGETRRLSETTYRRQITYRFSVLVVVASKVRPHTLYINFRYDKYCVGISFVFKSYVCNGVRYTHTKRKRKCF